METFILIIKNIKKNIIDYRLLFSYLPQENLFVPGTIKENIAFGEDTINKKILIELLKSQIVKILLKNLRVG